MKTKVSKIKFKEINIRLFIQIGLLYLIALAFQYITMDLDYKTTLFMSLFIFVLFTILAIFMRYKGVYLSYNFLKRMGMKEVDDKNGIYYVTFMYKEDSQKPLENDYKKIINNIYIVITLMSLLVIGLLFYLLKNEIYSFKTIFVITGDILMVFLIFFIGVYYRGQTINLPEEFKSNKKLNPLLKHIEGFRYEIKFGNKIIEVENAGNYYRESTKINDFLSENPDIEEMNNEIGDNVTSRDDLRKYDFVITKYNGDCEIIEQYCLYNPNTE